MDSRMLDVAIGLALVFALFGLLVTAIHEALAQAMKSRGKTLRVAVVSLLGDNAEMADKLMKHPLLVSMVEGDAKSRLRPSYLSADVFVSALISQLAKDYLPGEDKPPTPGEFVTRLAVKLPANLADSFKSLLPGTETDWPAFEKRLCAWYDAVGERATGWYKRKTQRDMLLIGTVAAALLNINPIVIGPRLWDDDVLRQSLVTAGEQASKAYSDALQKRAPGIRPSRPRRWRLARPRACARWGGAGRLRRSGIQGAGDGRIRQGGEDAGGTEAATDWRRGCFCERGRRFPRGAAPGAGRHGQAGEGPGRGAAVRRWLAGAAAPDHSCEAGTRRRTHGPACPVRDGGGPAPGRRPVREDGRPQDRRCR
ncbi:hypothetical protein PEC18_31040 [Paucibacter sp. O1-1]|nr:hypothetical protein [Paucibacter sp. O1-1]MDA3830141.1 hypothetical protein [Paucibacter sp. O1-1]